MFQQIFRAQSSDVIGWALAGLGIFFAIFVLRVLGIVFQSKTEIAERASLPLDEDDRHG